MSDQSSHKTTTRMGAGMIIAAWALVLGLFTFLFSDVLEEQRNPNQQVSSLSQQGVNEVVLIRNRFGHYVATGKINGKSVEFMLDTGASDVSVPGNLAQYLRLERGRAQVYNTANGPIQAFQTTLRNVQLGNIVISDVRASINPNVREDQILLGMSFLKHLEFTQRGDTLTLRQFL